LSDCDVGGSVESFNEGREDMGDMGDMGDMDNLISDINAFCGVDSNLSVGSVLGDDNYEEDQDVCYSSLSEESDIEENELNNEAALLNCTASSLREWRLIWKRRRDHLITMFLVKRLQGLNEDIEQSC